MSRSWGKTPCLLPPRPCGKEGCGQEATHFGWEATTMGTGGLDGHYHDGNCYGPVWRCSEKHLTWGDQLYSRACPVPGCLWMHAKTTNRKMECSAHGVLLELPEGDA